jgi:DNA-binding MarR family transcriptional regulator
MTTSSRHPVAFDFFLEIAVIDQLVSTEMERVLPEGVTMASFSLLNHLVAKGGIESPARLAQALQVTKGAVTALLKRLEGRGLVTLSQDPRDGRAKIIALTPEGRRRRDQAIARDLPGRLPRARPRRGPAPSPTGASGPQSPPPRALKGFPGGASQARSSGDERS